MGEGSKYWPLRRLIVEFINIYRPSVMHTQTVCYHSANEGGVPSRSVLPARHSGRAECAQGTVDIWELN